jgi:hypothetical protein
MIGHKLITLRHAVDAMQYQSYKPLNTVSEIEGEYFLPDTYPSPEELYSKNEALFKLPKESYMILQLIYNAPTEMIEGCKKGKLIKYIQSHFNWNLKKIEWNLNKLKTIL